MAAETPAIWNRELLWTQYGPDRLGNLAGLLNQYVLPRLEGWHSGMERNLRGDDATNNSPLIEAALAKTNHLIIGPGIYRLSSAIPEASQTNKHITLLPGAFLKPSTTINLYAKLHVHPIQPWIDEQTLGGQIRLQRLSVLHVFPEWWNPACDGVTSDWYALQRAAIEGQRAKAKSFAIGNYFIDQTLKFGPQAPAALGGSTGMTRFWDFQTAAFASEQGSTPQGIAWIGPQNQFMVEIGRISHSNFDALALHNITNAVPNTGHIIFVDSEAAVPPAISALGSMSRFGRLLLTGAHTFPSIRFGAFTDEGDGYVPSLGYGRHSNIENFMFDEIIWYDSDHCMLFDSDDQDNFMFLKMQSGGHPSNRERKYLIKGNHNGGYASCLKGLFRCDDMKVDNAAIDFGRASPPINFHDLELEAGTDNPFRAVDLGPNNAGRARVFCHSLSVTNFLKDTNGVFAKIDLGVGTTITGWNATGDILVTEPVIADGFTWGDDLATGDVLTRPKLRKDAVPEQFQITQAMSYKISNVRYAKAVTTGLTFSAAHVVNAGRYGIILVQIDAAGTVSTKVPLSPQVYTTAALARAAKPAADALNVEIGFIVLKAGALDWTANTDDMTVGSDCAWAQFNDNYRPEFVVSGTHGSVRGQGHVGRTATSAGVDELYSDPPADFSRLTLGKRRFREYAESVLNGFPTGVATDICTFAMANHRRVTIVLDYSIYRSGNTASQFGESGTIRVTAHQDSGGAVVVSAAAPVPYGVDNYTDGVNTIALAFAALMVGTNFTIRVTATNTEGSNAVMGQFEAAITSAGSSATTDPADNFGWSID